MNHSVELVNFLSLSFFLGYCHLVTVSVRQKNFSYRIRSVTVCDSFRLFEQLNSHLLEKKGKKLMAAERSSIVVRLLDQFEFQTAALFQVRCSSSFLVRAQLSHIIHSYNEWLLFQSQKRRHVKFFASCWPSRTIFAHYFAVSFAYYSAVTCKLARFFLFMSEILISNVFFLSTCSDDVDEVFAIKLPTDPAQTTATTVRNYA